MDLQAGKNGLHLRAQQKASVGLLQLSILHDNIVFAIPRLTEHTEFPRDELHAETDLKQNRLVGAAAMRTTCSQSCSVMEPLQLRTAFLVLASQSTTTWKKIICFCVQF